MKIPFNLLSWLRLYSSFWPTVERRFQRHLPYRSVIVMENSSVICFFPGLGVHLEVAYQVLLNTVTSFRSRLQNGSQNNLQCEVNFGWILMVANHGVSPNDFTLYFNLISTSLWAVTTKRIPWMGPSFSLFSKWDALVMNTVLFSLGGR